MGNFNLECVILPLEIQRPSSRVQRCLQLLTHLHFQNSWTHHDNRADLRFCSDSQNDLLLQNGCCKRNFRILANSLYSHASYNTYDSGSNRTIRNSELLQNPNDYSDPDPSRGSAQHFPILLSMLQLPLYSAFSYESH